MKFFKIILFTLFFFTAARTFAQSSDELKRRRNKLNEELEQLNRDLDQANNNKKANLKQLSLLKAQISLRTAKIDNINSEIKLLDGQIRESTNTVSNLQGQLDLLKKEYAAMVLFAYHNQSSYNKLMFVFAADNFNQSYKRMKFLQQFGSYRERQATAISNTQNDLHVKINELDKTKKDKSNLLQDQEKEKASLGKEKNDEVQVISDITKQTGQIKQQQKDKQNRINETNRQITAAIKREFEEEKRRALEEARKREAAETAKAKAEGRPVEPSTVKKITKNSSYSEILNATPEAARLSSDFLGNKGLLPWPVAKMGGVVRGFGPYTEGGIRNENTGIDIRTSEGASIRAVFNGEVFMIADVSGSYTVVIKHGEYLTAYGNLKSTNVSKGQKVTTKQILGTVETDNSTGLAIATFSLYKNATAVNPLPWLAPN